jgi:ankyrin
MEHQAEPNYEAKNGLTPLHLCAQEDRVNVAAILVKNNAEINAQTKVKTKKRKFSKCFVI